MDARQRNIGRRFIGQPRIWRAWALLAIGLAWLAISAVNAAGGTSPAPSYVVAGIFLAFGVASLIVSIRDRRLGLGAYQDSESIERGQE